MYFEGEYKLVTAVDIGPLRAAVDALTEADWKADTSRQETFKPHSRTQSIGLIYDQDMRHEHPSVRPAYAQMDHAVAPVMSIIASCLGPKEIGGAPPYYVRAILVRLAAGEAIATHRDFGPSLSRAHRIHVPIRTNPGAEFGIAGVVRHLPAGEAWEINNRKPHAVRNEGGEDRIHLILDYVIPGEVVHDPDGTLIA